MRNISTLVGLVSTTARSVDEFSIFLTFLSGIMCVTIFTMIAVFAIRYRRHRVKERYKFKVRTQRNVLGRLSHWEFLWRFRVGSG